MVCRSDDGRDELASGLFFGVSRDDFGFVPGNDRNSLFPGSSVRGVDAGMVSSSAVDEPSLELD